MSQATLTLITVMSEMLSMWLMLEANMGNSRQADRLNESEFWEHVAHLQATGTLSVELCAAIGRIVNFQVARAEPKIRLGVYIKCRDDAVSELTEQLYRALQTDFSLDKSLGSVTAFALTVVKNRLRNWKRDNISRPAKAAVARARPAVARKRRGFQLRVDSVERLIAAIPQLSARDQELLECVRAKMSYKEIEQRFGWKRCYAKVYVHRLRRRLERLMS